MNGDCLIAILAAGRGERFGGRKLDAELGGKPLGQYALDAAIASGDALPAIVVGEPAPRFAVEAARQGQAVLVVNPDPARGLGGSIICAARYALESGFGKLLLMLADMPLVENGTLAALVSAAGEGRPSAVTYPDGSPGIPACFPASHLEALAGIDPAQGAKPYLRSLDRLSLIEIEHRQLLDVDTADDLAELALQHRL